ncbi:bacteriocin immunity protein [Streptococcus equinus]|uniref:bacteriocin immunity protein n=1 Tax=Streptococcus equinus TaxID=1335 RepID=UPI000504255F|nr:bacteriocin immunity protein [Streptococcus equinus]KFN86692.1 enterocin A Immunity protein [Streptococcus equinus ATCC 33317]MBE6163037.1 bacteriocin immunity protein [Streptococcus equinus]SDQ34686.1 Enterocin A Immunity [Streptococcus equinus]SEK58640.1 Enterocin A Immunity [Streptococcus equinus]SEN75295.1 Enterocin A Immunity [Streptococcus equinus]
MSQITKEQIMDQVYNLILNIETKENERKALINFKNEIEAGKEFERNLMKLAESLREISVKNISEKTTMSIGVREFYKSISSYGQLKKNFGRGLAVSGFMF